MQRDKSLEASEYAAKKKAALQKANAMRQERDEAKRSGGGGAGVATSATVQSYRTAERIVIHRPEAPLALPSSARVPSSFSSLPASLPPPGDLFCSPPSDAAGREYDLSSRPLLCWSSFSNPSLRKREIVFGSADHALYSISSVSPGHHPAAVVKMYTKQFGHSDWVTAVTHLADGRVVSSAMDGKLCLWELNKRRCANLAFHTKSVSKVLSIGEGVFLSASYDGTVAAWNVDGAQQPRAVLSGHKSPVIELACRDGLVASGGRDGAVLTWDLTSGEQLQRVRGHEAPVTALHIFSPSASASSLLLLSGAADGTVKLWDPRSKQLVSSGVSHPGVPITGLESASGELLFTSGASGGLLVFDWRKGFKSPDSALHNFEQARNGVYCLARATSSLFVGDGVGTVLCYDLSTMTLRYGLGSSRVGAVRCLAAFPDCRVLAVGNEDGKALLYDY